MPTYLKIDKVSKNFGAFRALDNISLDIDTGEFVCFLGPSGCGKTTLLRAIAGLAPQSSGRILQDGIDISPLDPSQRDFGIVFQSYALFPNLTVAQNIDFGLRNIGKRGAEARQRVDYLLNLVGITEHATKYPAQLSGGQQQRVALARALAIEPGLLLLDEPLSALDAQVRINLRNELRALQRKVGVTTIMVTHDQEEALAIADRIVVMNAGRIEQYGTPREIYRHPATPFVARFVGDMNFLNGTVCGADEVSVGAHRLTCATGGRRHGEDVTLCIRPEDIALRSGDTASGNLLQGVIEQMDFLGAFSNIRLTARGEDRLALTVNASANATHDLKLESGRELRVHLPPERLRVFDRMAQAKAAIHG